MQSNWVEKKQHIIYKIIIKKKDVYIIISLLYIQVFWIQDYVFWTKFFHIISGKRQCAFHNIIYPFFIYFLKFSSVFPGKKKTLTCWH